MSTEYPTAKPRRPYAEDVPGYVESDKDYLLNNRDLAVRLLDEFIQAQAPEPEPCQTPSRPLMTNEEFLASGGGRCPRCRSADIQSWGISVDGTVAWSDVSCNDCHLNWQETFTMSGYTTEFSDNEEP